MPLHITRQFKRAIHGDPSNCVLFVGAGLSASGVRRGGKGLPDWDTLTLHMIEDLRDSQNCDASTLARLEELLEESNHLEIARVFKQRTRPDQCAAFLRVELDPADIIPSKVHDTILRTNYRGIITTNFDLVFEHQSNRLQPLVYPQCLDDVNAFRRDGFFAKIHGCIRQTPNLADNLVLTKDNYVSLRTNRRYHSIMHSLFVMYTILTVGFSLRDPDFLGLVDDLRKIFGEGMPTIYALMLDPGRTARDEWRRTKGVEIIPYDNHGELLGFFEEMLGLKPVPPEPETNYKRMAISGLICNISVMLSVWISQFFVPLTASYSEVVLYALGCAIIPAIPFGILNRFAKKYVYFWIATFGGIGILVSFWTFIQLATLF